jgi:Tfp pilus assembly protein PilO
MNVKLKPKQFFFVMIAIMVLSFGGIIAAFYWGNKRLEAKSSVLSSLKTDYDISEAKIEALKRAEDSSELADDATKLLDTLLPRQKEQEKLLADIIYTASGEAGIPVNKLGAISFSGGGEPSDLSGTEESEDIAGVYTYPFTMSITKISYDTLLKLLQEIESNGRLVQIDNLQISPDKENPGQLTAVSLSLKAFLRP